MVNLFKTKICFKSAYLFCCAYTLLLGVTTSAFGQEQRIADNLQPIYVADTVQGIDKLKLLSQLAYNESNDFKLALHYAQELIQLSKALNDEGYLYQGYLQEGNAHYSDENFIEAIESYNQGTKVAQKLQDKSSEGVVLMSIADTYSSLDDHDQAEVYYERSINLLKRPDVLLVRGDSISLGRSYFNAGDELLKSEKYEKAIIYLGEAEKLFRLTQQYAYLPYVIGNKGIYYGEQALYETAEEFLLNSISSLLSDQAFVAAAEYQTYLANLYLKQNRISAAERLAINSLNHAKKLGIMLQISESSLILSKVYKAKRNFEKAYNYYLDYHVYKDSVTNYDVRLKFNNQRHEFTLSEKQAELDLSIKESEIKDLKTTRQRGIIWGTTIGLLLLSALAYGLFRRYSFIKRTNTIIAQEKDRSDELLLNILPAATAKELKKNGEVKAQRFESVTVLFTDFFEFTKYSEVLHPEALVESVDFYFSKFDKIMEKHGLEKIKTVGDAYLCAGGLPFPTTDHAHKMTLAAQDILEFVNAVKKEKTDGQVRFDIRIGMNTGPVIAGVVGTKKFAYDIWGDTVNVASRMESNSEPGKINISEYTYNLIKYDYDCEFRGSIKVKNRGDMNMYFLGEPKQ